jgi:hypothetical protein
VAARSIRDPLLKVGALRDECWWCTKSTKADQGGRWNQAWRDFFEAKPGATKEDVFKELGKMIDEFNLPLNPIVPYHR